MGSELLKPNKSVRTCTVSVVLPGAKMVKTGLPCLDRLTQKCTNTSAHNIEDVDTNGEICEAIVGIVLSMTLYDAVHWLQ